jgi:hypothetical protein
MSEQKTYSPSKIAEILAAQELKATSDAVHRWTDAIKQLEEICNNLKVENARLVKEIADIGKATHGAKKK